MSEHKLNQNHAGRKSHKADYQLALTIRVSYAKRKQVLGEDFKTKLHPLATEECPIDKNWTEWLTRLPPIM